MRLQVDRSPQGIDVSRACALKLKGHACCSSAASILIVHSLRQSVQAGSLSVQTIWAGPKLT